MVKIQNSNFLTVLVIVVLVLTAVNLVGLFAVSSSVINLSGKLVTNPSPQPSGDDIPSQPSINAADLVDDDPSLGRTDAPLTIVEFSDFQCPFCERFHSQTFPLIKQQYIDTGKVRFVYRDFPLGFHPNAEPAALVAECADEQGKFWEFHDKIFENQETLSDAMYRIWAQELGLNTEQFNSCLDSGKYRAEVQKDLADGTAAGIGGTPGFFVGEVPISGAQPFSVFQQVIDAQLSS